MHGPPAFTLVLEIAHRSLFAFCQYNTSPGYSISVVIRSTMTTRRRNSDLAEDESRSHKYHRMQPGALSQIHPSEDPVPQSEKGISVSGVPSDANPAWKGNDDRVSAEGPLIQSCVKAIQPASPKMDPGLGQLSLLSPEIRDLIYELIPVEDDPEIASSCQPEELRWTSKSLSRDLRRSKRPCTHIDFTFTCDVSSKGMIEDRYRWIQSKLHRDAHAHNLQNIHRVKIFVKSSANPDLPTLCYRLVCSPGDRKVVHIWFDGPRAGHARLCKLQDQLAGSFKAAAVCINATMEMMRRLPSHIINDSTDSDSMKVNDSKLSKLLRWYAAPQAEERNGPAGGAALCMIACPDPGDELLEYSFHPLARRRLQESMRHGFVIEDCPLPVDRRRLQLDLFVWHHEFFDWKAEWESRPQDDWLVEIFNRQS